MTLSEAIAQQPAWIGWWLIWLMIGAFLLPALLLIWRRTRLAGALILLAGLAGGFSVDMLYQRMGYVKLIGLPHIVFWTPLAVYLWLLLRRPGLPPLPRWIIAVTLVTILISLAFDYADVARYLLGERSPLPMPAPG